MATKHYDTSHISKATMDLVNHATKLAIDVYNLEDDVILTSLSDIKKNIEQITEQTAKAVKAINRAHVVLNGERLRRNIEETANDKQLSIFDVQDIKAIKAK